MLPDATAASPPAPAAAREALDEPPEIAVTGVGAVSALGWGVAALRQAIDEGRDGIGPAPRFADRPDGFPGAHAALVPDGGGGFDDASLARGCDQDGPWVRFALAAAREALAMAGLDGGGAGHGERLAVVLGTLRGHDAGEHRLAAVVGEALGARGPRIEVAAACASSTQALGLAIDLLRAGQADRVLAGGADVVTPDMYAGFHGLGLLAPERCAPFALPAGTTLGEGAAFLVLERGEAARARGARVLGALLGYGLSADAYHATTPDPTGAGLARAIAAALHDAGLEPAAIGYVNAHGTGTESNDAAEWLALRRALGERAATIPISSSKSIFGHAQGAAGALEALVTIDALARQAVPPTLHVVRRRPRLGLDPVAEGRPRPHRFAAALSINAAFGGTNGVVALGLPGARGRRRARRAIEVRGAAAIGPHGATLEGLQALVEGAAAPGEPGEPEVEALLPMADTRGLDPTGRFLVAAAARALVAAGLRPRERHDRAGLFAGSSLLSPATGRELNESIARRGLSRISAAAFTRIVLNAPAGAACLLLGLRGPTTTVGAGVASGAAALWHAAQHLAGNDEVDLLLAGGVHEAPRAGDPQGAAMVVLAAAGAGGGAPWARLAGWGLAGPGGGAAAAAAALAMDDEDVESAPPAGRAVDVVATLGVAGPEALPGVGAASERLTLPAVLAAMGAAASAVLVVAAVDRLRRLPRRGGAALVVVEARDAASCALLLRVAPAGEAA